MSKILITGGGGSLGKSIAKELSEAGHSLLILDNLSNCTSEDIQHGPLLKRDVREVGPIEMACKKDSINGLIHLVFDKRQDLNEKELTEQTEFNYSTTLALYKVAVQAKLKWFMYVTPESSETREPAKDQSYLLLKESFSQIANSYQVKIKRVMAPKTGDNKDFAVELLRAISLMDKA